MRERNALEDQTGAIRRLEQDLEVALTLIELGEAEGDQASVREGESAIRRVEAEAARRQIESLLAGEADPNDTYLEVHSGAGGTESQDWAQMLQRMCGPLGREARLQGRRRRLDRRRAGRDQGRDAPDQGPQRLWLAQDQNRRAPAGAHLAVQFERAPAREFASVWVYPVVDDKIDIEVKEWDCRIDTYRSSGAGGQHVNTTNSAVRITHLPTGIVVACQQERSQHKNRATAWNMLRARLYEAELKRREEKASAEAASKTDIGWGHQIRSYVLQPYQLVKDLRTGVQSTSPSDVLDGELDPFMEAALAKRIQGGGGEVEDID